MVSFYMNTEHEERGVPHMIKALELNPQVHNAEAMRFILKGIQIDSKVSENSQY